MKGTIILILIVLLWICGFQILILKETQNIYNTIKTDTIYLEASNEIEFTNDLFYEFIKETGIKFPKVVMAQAILESGHFTSELFKQNRNPFGMMRPLKRPTTSIEKEDFAKYENWRYAVLDYWIWQHQHSKTIKTEEEYLALLQNIYAEDINYKQKLKRIMRTIN